MEPIKGFVDIDRDIDQVFDFLMNHPMIQHCLATGQLTKQDLLNQPIDCLDYIQDLTPCKDCKGLKTCPKDAKGYQIVLRREETGLDREIEACHYLKEDQQVTKANNYLLYHNVSEAFFNYQMEDLIPYAKNDKVLSSVLKDIISSTSTLDQQSKGIYLGGEKGFIQSYVASATVRYLIKHQKEVVFIAFPEYVSQLKRSMNDYQQFMQLSEKVKNAPILVIDDLGNESTISQWSRDEVLGGLLTSRMHQQKPTFIFSMYQLDELYGLYQLGQSTDVKARVLMERIKGLCRIYEMGE